MQTAIQSLAGTARQERATEFRAHLARAFRFDLRALTPVQNEAYHAMMSSRARQQANVPGIVGLCLVLVATILSPTGLLGITLPFLMLFGFGGLIVCGVSLVWRPRWPGVTGLSLGALCIAAWVGFFAWAFMRVHGNAAAIGLNVGQHAQMSMAAMALVEAAEAQRTTSGAPPASVALTGPYATIQPDPWGRAYRYVIVNTPRGYTFMSDGPDRLANTGDDIDILTIQRDGMFSLPPPAPSAAAATQPSNQIVGP